MQLIIPMSGKGQRFKDAGYRELKPLIPIHGKSMLEHLYDCYPKDWQTSFICNELHRQELSIAEKIQAFAPNSNTIFIPDHKKGPVWAVLEADRVDNNFLSQESGIVISYCDFAFRWDPKAFESLLQKEKCDGVVFCYTGFHPEYIRPNLYAYCKTEGSKILEIKEKGHFTPDRTKEYASSGTYYFRNADIIKKYFQHIFSDQSQLINGEGYISVVYNQMIRDGLDIRVFEIPFFLQWGTPDDLEDYLYWQNCWQKYESLIQARDQTKNNLQLLMPMAGKGSRFGQEVPKPLIEIEGRKMFAQAIAHLPSTKKESFVVRSDFAKQTGLKEDQQICLDHITEGQAISTEFGAEILDPDIPVLVSSCDHGLLWEQKKLESFLEKAFDLIIFGQRNYTAANVTPEAFAYISTKANSNEISSVSVKKAISANPRKDLLLVGTFIFRSKELLLDLIDELKSKNIRVNNELYLDSVANLAIERGLKTFCLETDAYLCWGTPDSLAEYNYWSRYFHSLE